MSDRSRSYRPGSRRPDLGKGDAEMSEYRWAWLKCNLGQLVIMVDPTETGDPDVKLVHPFPRGRGVTFNLTGLTEVELLAFKKLVNTSIDWALPIVQERDANAAAALEQGDDRYPRVYRSLPQLVFRKGHESSHWEELRSRSQRSDGVGGDEQPRPELVDPNAGLPQVGGAVPDRNTGGEGSEDDGA